MRLKTGTIIAVTALLAAAITCTRQEEQGTSSAKEASASSKPATGETKTSAGGQATAAAGGERFTMAGTGPRPADNNFCLVCHELLADELITKVHAQQNVLCVDCHGPSTLHMEDEMLMTRPDVLYGRTEVEPLCRHCHGPHKTPTQVEAFREKWYGRDLPNGRVVSSQSICTDCHGTHNLAGKTEPKKKAGANLEQEQPWISLFNGKDLTGWKPVGNAKWTVERGAIVGVQGDHNAPGDLLTEASYQDFLLTVTYRVEWPCNSGIWFRYQSAQKAYQADILEIEKPACYSGSLYYTNEKSFLAINTDKDLVDRDGWNTMSVGAQGDHLQVWLNGRQVADVHDQTSDSGQIGFQVHPGAGFAAMKIIVSEAKLQPLK